VVGADWLDADGDDAPLPVAVLDWVLVAGLRAWKPNALPLG
jgi:hypothetical protein